MISNAEAIRSAASYVAENDAAFTAAYNDSRAHTQGNSARTVRDALRNAVAGRGDQFGAVNLAATWLASHEQYLRPAVEQAVRNGTLPRGTTTQQAAQFLNTALGVRPQAVLHAPEVRQEQPVAALRDEFVAALEGKTGRIKVTIEVDEVETLQELLGL